MCEERIPSVTPQQPRQGFHLPNMDASIEIAAAEFGRIGKMLLARASESLEALGSRQLLEQAVKSVEES